MAFLVDGFNLLHRVPRLKALLQREGPGPACAALTDVLARWTALGGREVVLVFDGLAAHGARLTAPGLSVRYVGSDADPYLRELLSRPGGPYVLVSKDEEITRPARARGYDDLDPGRFFAEACQAVADAGEADERDRDLERWEVDMWLDVFKDDPLE
ncbi:MAG: NYN domain-containing protein [Planctomycetes bacterium]|nr:NYN domain-containing protein [Planctomycetota bacterium]